MLHARTLKIPGTFLCVAIFHVMGPESANRAPCVTHVRHSRCFGIFCGAKHISRLEQPALTPPPRGAQATQPSKRFSRAQHLSFRAASPVLPTRVPPSSAKERGLVPLRFVQNIFR